MSIDIIELIEAYDVYVLPPIVVGAMLHVLLRRGCPVVPPAGEDASLRLRRLDRERTIRRAGLLNYGLAARAIVRFIPTLQARVVLGEHGSIPFVDVVLPIIVAIANVIVGFGVRRLRSWGRWCEAVWNGLVAAVVLPLSLLLWRYGEAIYAADWPDIAVAKVLPIFLLVLMLLPGTAKVVSAEHRALIARTPEVANWRVKGSLVSALTVGFLVVVASVVLRDALDWIVRTRYEISASP